MCNGMNLARIQSHARVQSLSKCQQRRQLQFDFQLIRPFSCAWRSCASSGPYQKSDVDLHLPKEGGKSMFKRVVWLAVLALALPLAAFASSIDVSNAGGVL
jgi:hypothetical protein